VNLHRTDQSRSFLIHNIRLSYLRNVEDPYSRQLVSFSSNHVMNQHVLAAGLADTTRFPELLATASPQPSDTENPASYPVRPSGFPGATGLQYTQTILGPSRTGGLGMGVRGKRSSAGRSPRGHAGDDSTVHVPDRTPINGATLKPSSAPSIQVAVEGPTPDTAHFTAVTTASTDHVPAMDTVFVPKFKGAAEMEARRQKRMMARQRALSARTGVPAAPARDLNPDLSSSSEPSEDEGIQPASDESDNVMSDFDVDDVPEAEDEMDEDEFDLYVPKGSLSCSL
jgi:target of rapamycin complex 2 subunit MAPKAP1